MSWRTNEDMIYLISDIHGMYYTLKKLLDKITLLDNTPSFVFIGDYVDGGLHVFQVIEELISLQEEGHVVLRGNHEEAFDWFVNDRSAGSILFSKHKAMSSIHEFGFDKTLASYGILNHNKHNKLLEQFKLAVPQSHKEFIRSLPVFWKNETHFACHAFMNPACQPAFSLTPKNIYKSINMDFNISEMHHSINWDKIGVFGHISGRKYKLKYPYKISNIRIIDDGGIYGEKLIAYCSDTDEFISEPISREDLKYS